MTSARLLIVFFFTLSLPIVGVLVLWIFGRIVFLGGNIFFIVQKQPNDSLVPETFGSGVSLLTFAIVSLIVAAFVSLLVRFVWPE